MVARIMWETMELPGSINTDPKAGFPHSWGLKTAERAPESSVHERCSADELEAPYSILICGYSSEAPIEEVFFWF